MENTLLCAYRAVALGQQIQVDACLEAHPAAMAATLALLQHRHTPSVPARSHRCLAYRLVSIICRTWIGPPAKPRRASGAGLWQLRARGNRSAETGDAGGISRCRQHGPADGRQTHGCRSEEHTSELQSQSNLVCRLLLEKKKTQKVTYAVAVAIASDFDLQHHVVVRGNKRGHGSRGVVNLPRDLLSLNLV